MPDLASDRTLAEARASLVALQAAERTFPEGAHLYRRGERPTHFYLILSGAVALVGEGPDGAPLPFRTLEAGAFVGDLPILRREPSQADAVARRACQVLECPAVLLPLAVDASPAVRSLLIGGLVGARLDARAEQRDLYRDRDAFDLFLYPDLKSGPIVAESTSMRRLLAGLEAGLQGVGPLLLRGEPGTGKFFLAAHLHERWTAGAARPASGRRPPFVALDGRQLERRPLHEVLPRLAHHGLRVARLDVAAGLLEPTEDCTLILRHVDRLQRASQELLLGLLQLAAGMAARPGPHLRVIATTTADLRERVREGSFQAELADLLLAGAHDLPPLRERRDDVAGLTGHFLRQADPARAVRLTRGAERRLRHLRFRRDNCAGLRRAIEFAVPISRGGEIEADHVGIDPDIDAPLFSIQLDGLGWFRWLTRDAVQGAIRAGMVAGFAAIVVAGLRWSDGWAGQLANRIVWWAWQPALFFLFLFSGRLWCSVCPISTGAGFLQRRLGLGRKVPALLRRWGPSLGILTFAAIISAEHALEMPTSPGATAGLLLVLVGAATLMGLAWERQAWCSHVCPLGALGASYGIGSALQLRADASLCANVCTEHRCVEGAGGQPGCPVAHHPLHAAAAQACVQCLRCVATCPHQSPRLYAQPPLQNVWALGSVSGEVSSFSFFLFFYALGMLWLEVNPARASRPLVLLSVAGLALLGSLAHRAWVRRLFGAEVARDGSLLARLGAMLAVMAWGPLVAYELGRVPLLADFSVRAVPGTFMERSLGAIDTPLPGLVQVAVILLAAALALLGLSRIRAKLVRQQTPVSPGAWRAMRLTVLGYVVAATAIVTRG